MEKIIRKQIGKESHVFVITGNDFHELILNSKKLSFDDLKTCGLCGSDDLELTAHVTEKRKHKYTCVRCKNRACRACLNLGQKIDDSNVVYFRTIETGEKDKNGKPIKKYDWRTAEQQKLDLDNDND